MAIVNKAQLLRTLPTIILAVSFLFHFIGYTSSYWYLFESRQPPSEWGISTSNQNACRLGSVQHIGLWQYCVKELKCDNLCHEDYCQSIHKIKWKPAKFEGAQVYTSFAFASYIVGIVFALVKIFRKGKCIILHPVIGFFAIAAGCFSMLAVILFGTLCSSKGLYDKDRGLHQFKSSNFHFSFAFCILGAIAAITSGVLYIVVWRRESALYNAAKTSDRGDGDKGIEIENK